MKLFLMPKEPTWWVWLITALLIAAGLAGQRPCLVLATALSVLQALFFLWKHRSFKPYSVQIRLTYAACMIAYLPPALNAFYWVPAIGTFALLIFGYCLLARMLSLMPWNRRVPITAELIWRTFLSAPVAGRVEHGLPAGMSVCEQEATAGQRY